MERSNHQVFNDMSLRDIERPCKDTKKQFMRSHQENAFKNIMMASSKLQNLKNDENKVRASQETIKVKEKRKSFMNKLWSKNSQSTVSRIFEGGGDSRKKIQSSGDSKMNQTNTFTTNQFISNQLPGDDYQSSQKALQMNKQSSNFPLNSQEFDKIILDKDPNTLNPYINGPSLKKHSSKPKEKVKMQKIQKNSDQDKSEDLNDKAETKSAKNETKEGACLKKMKQYKRHQSILLPESSTIHPQKRENQVMNSQDGNALKSDRYEKKGSNSYHRAGSCSQSLSSNMFFRTQQKFLSKRSECDSISINQKFGTNIKKGKLGLSHLYQQSFNYEQFNQHLEKMYAEQIVVQDSESHSISQHPGMQRKSIIGTRRKLAKTKKKYGVNKTNRPQTEFNIYQSIMHDNGPDQQNSRRIGRHLRYLTQDDEEQSNLPFNAQRFIAKPEQKLHNIITSAQFTRKSGRQQVPKILKEQSNKHIRNKTILQSFMFKTKVKQFKEDIKDTFTNQKKQKQKANKDPDQMDSDDYLKAFDDMEVDPELLRERKNNEEGMFLIYPDSIYRAAWDISLFLSIIYQSISLPARISFEVKFSEFLFILEIIIDVMFIIDIVLNFNTGIYVKTRLILQRKKIALDYLKWWFWIDLVSSLPLTWILAWSQGITLRQVESDDQMSQLTDSNISSSVMADAPGLLKLLKVSKLLKMLKLLRVAKLKKLMIKFEEYIVTDSMDLMVTFFNITVKIMFIAHYMGCFFYYKGMDSMRLNSEGWLLSEEMLDIGIMESYITSIYWAFTTMSAVGYGDITPVTKDEQRYTMIAMVLSCGIFAYTINSISNIVSRFNKNSSVYREKMMYVNQFLKSKDMPQETRMKVRRYLDYVFQQKKEIKIEEADVYKILNESLRDQVQLIINGRIVNKLLFLENFGLDFLSELTMKLESTSFIQDDFIFMEKDKADCMYFIITGKVAMIHKQSSTFISDLGNGEYFGEYGLLKEENRCLSAKCRDFTEAYVITKKDFEDVSENCTDAIKSIRQIKVGLDKDDLKYLKVKCYICGKNDHLALRCNQFSKWRGNLMRILMQQNKEKEEMDSDDEKEASKVADEENSLKKQKFFIYAEEAHEAKIQVSEESDETLKIKTNLIRYNVKGKMDQLDGQLISTFFEFPQFAYNQGFCDVLSPSPHKRINAMSTSSVVRGRQGIPMSNDQFDNFLLVNQNYDSEQIYSPEFPRLPITSKPIFEDSISCIAHQSSLTTSPNRAHPQQLEWQLQKQMNKSFKLAKIPEEQDNIDNSQGDSDENKVMKQIQQVTQQRVKSSNSSSSKSSQSGLTSSSFSTPQNSNSKKIQFGQSQRGKVESKQMTHEFKQENVLDYQKNEAIIDLSNCKQQESKKDPLSPKNDRIQSNSFSHEKNSDINTERTDKKIDQTEAKTLQQQKKNQLQQLQKELTINSRNSKSKGSHLSGNLNRGGTGGKKRMASRNWNRRRGSTASRLEQSFDAYNHQLTQTGLHLKKVNTQNTSKSRSQWARMKSESQQIDIQRSKKGEDSKHKDQQHIFTNSVSLSKKISVIEEEKNNIEKDETYLEDTPNHQKREQRSQQEALRQNHSFINEVINSSLGDIKSSTQGFYIRDSARRQGDQFQEKKNIKKNRPIVDSEVFQIKSKMGHTHKLSKQMVNEIQGLLSPKSSISLSSKQI